ncbi:hypothetical protein [Undibacterium flavidum]|uniref:Uncharacterized protein n=1 Tax=Undibacterium flavidum TaxID=2762297 RepID=A0ABR6YGS0_9BURK|nr:hypothetical protein [Undibacterium flavidum]MBC3875781.1 hypothetical protein [Undibacterium flavidum]
MRIFKGIGVLIFVLLANFLFWRLGGVPVLALGICLAVAGSGNRTLWFFVFTLFASLTFAIYFFGVLPIALENNIFVSVLGFGLLPLFPALLMWSAHSLRARRKLLNSKI